MSFVTELKRRNVIRMAGLYLVGAWLIVQVAGTVLPTFDVPSWVMRILIIVLMLGLIPALIFSWVFEFTPEGLKREEEVTPADQAVAPQTARAGWIARSSSCWHWRWPTSRSTNLRSRQGETRHPPA